jgi:hypothetical protein
MNGLHITDVMPMQDYAMIDHGHNYKYYNLISTKLLFFHHTIIILLGEMPLAMLWPLGSFSG